MSSGEDPVEVGRYIEALRRSRWLIVSIVTIVTVAVAAYSLSLAKSYEATASIVVNNTSGLLGGNESAAIQRNLATTATLATTAAVLGEAAKSFPGQTRTSLAKKVAASVSENANIITIKVQYGSAVGAATLAGAVAQAFLNQHASIERSQTAGALAALNGQIAALRARASSEPNIAAQLSALQARAAELEAQSAGSGTQLQLVQRPEVPSAASSPRPTRNAVIALFASIFLAVLVALGREQLTPRITSQRELGHLLALPVLSGIPLIGRRVSARYARAEYETYQTLSAAIRLALPPRAEPHVMLVTSAAHGEGKTTVTTRLGRMLAQAGHRTLVISGDLRWPKLDDAFNVGGRPGLRELLALTPESEQVAFDAVKQVIQHTHNGEGVASRGELDVLPAGRRGGDASELLAHARPAVSDRRAASQRLLCLRPDRLAACPGPRRRTDVRPVLRRAPPGRPPGSSEDVRRHRPSRDARSPGLQPGWPRGHRHAARWIAVLRRSRPEHAEPDALSAQLT